MIAWNAVGKDFGSKTVLNNLTLEIAEGSSVTLLGPNGAGKTTSLRLLLGLLTPDRGSIEVFGHPPGHMSTKTDLHCLPQESEFPANIKVIEILNYITSLYPAPETVESLLVRFQLKGLELLKASVLSGGQKRCLGLACAFAQTPKVLVLDEPTVGLDIEVRRQIWQEIEMFSEAGGTLILTTHHMDEAEALSSRIVVMNRGEILTDGSPQEIRAQYGHRKISFHCKDILKHKGLKRLNQSQHYEGLFAAPEELLKELINHHHLTQLRIEEVSLEEILLNRMKASNETD